MAASDAPQVDRAARLASARAALATTDGQRLLLTAPASIRWLTGFTGSAGRVLVGPDGPPLLVTDNRYEQRAAGEAPGCEIVLDRTWGWLPERLPEGIALTVEADGMTWATAREVADLLDGHRLIPTEGLLTHARAVKDAAEIAAIRMACAITVTAFDHACGWLAPGQTERAIARRLSDTMRDLGADGDAFPAIVAGGPNGAVPHHAPTDRAVERGDLLTMDFGALADGYHADMTRTVAIGDPTPKLRRIHDLVRVAQQAGVEVVAAGVDTAAVDAACRTVIADAGHGEDFRHGTGHGVGLEIHEPPFLGASTAGTLTAGMAITVEPGVYVPGLGGVRIEDVVLVGETGAERLTTAAHDLIVI